MQSFELKAREKERTFFRRVSKNRNLVTTGSGATNRIVEVTANAIVIQSKKREEPIKISRQKLREAIRFLYFRRSTTRKELEAFSNFSSCLMGLLRLVFHDAKITKTVKGLLRITLKGVRFFFAGTDRSPSDLILARKHGARFVLLTFFHIRNDVMERWKHWCKKLGLYVLLDSGAFSEYKARMSGKAVKPVEVRDLALFIKKHLDVLFAWINLDVVGDPVKSKKNAEFLRSVGLGHGLIEVWHVQSGFDALEEMVQEDHACIAVGGSVFVSKKERRSFFGELFDRFSSQNFHLLGGGAPLAFDFPWMSCDATSWLSGRMFGKIITPQGNIKAPAGWSAMACLIFNVIQLCKLEENEQGIFQLEMIIPPIAG